MKLRLAQNKDLKFIFNLYNQNILEKNFFSKKKIQFNEHKDWFKKNIKEKRFFICLIKNKVGYVRFEKIDKKNLSVSIAVKKKYKRKGYGKTMLIKALNKKTISKFNIFANIKSKNLISKKFFLNSGFKLVRKNKFMIKAK
tara:strand:+ start:15 stop:437 length:423 start_codon:yes stop_codon:yes gene_type:complete